jgi:hypothetical protein
MHLPTHKLFRNVTINPHPTIIPDSQPHDNISSPTSSALQTLHGKINTKDKRNIKVGIVALRQISKWTDKAALTLEKLEGQQDSKHCQDRQMRMEEGKGKQEREWKDTVVYYQEMKGQEVGVSRGLGMPKETGAYQEQVYESRVYGTHNLRPLEDPVPSSEWQAHEKREQKVKFEDVKLPHPEAYQPYKLPVLVAEVEEEEEEEEDSDSEDEEEGSGDEADDEKDRDLSESEDEQDDGDGEDTSDEEDSEVSSDEEDGEVSSDDEDEDDSSDDKDSEVEDSEAEAERHEALAKVAGPLKK